MIFHVLNRGNARDQIFEKAADYLAFEKVLAETMLLPGTDLTWEELRNKTSPVNDVGAREAPRNHKTRARRRRILFRTKHGIRPTVETSGRNFLQEGARFLEKNDEGHSFQRFFVSVRHGNAMFTPGLYVSMLPEAGFRAFLSESANLLTGESTGALGSLTARMRLNIRTPEQITLVNRLARDMANEGVLIGHLFRDFMYTKSRDDANKLVRGAEWYASVMNAWQDPTKGTPQLAVMKRYIEAILRGLDAMPLQYGMSVEGMVANLYNDPLYFEKNWPELHNFAVNSVADHRSVKNTPYSLFVRKFYEPLVNHHMGSVRFIGTINKMTLMYAPYIANVLTTVSGSQGTTAALSALLDHQQTPGTLARRISRAITAKVDGKPPIPLTLEEDKRFDLSSTMDAVTLGNAFVRGGVTHTGLFLMGMLAGNIGLSGEDKEARRRRKLAEAQRVVDILDPRDLQNDFRNKDMVFIDGMSWLPDELLAFFRITEEEGESRSAFQMSWIMKPFISPIIGMEKFFQTGDFDWVISGFGDAVGSFPLWNKAVWDDAVRASKELEALAAEQAQLPDQVATKNTSYLLLNMVGVMEKMLLENMFINSLYTGFDAWDRDPYAMPLRDSDGDVQKLSDNTPRANDRALVEYIDPITGQVKTGYASRTPQEAMIAGYTENNFGAAALMSLFTGFDDGYFRRQMPVKLREIKLETLTDEQAKAVVALALRNSGSTQRMFSQEELVSMVKADAIAADDWDTFNDAEAIAKAFYDSPNNPQWDPLSILDDQGFEKLTNSGADAVIRGLYNGTLTLDDPAIRRLGISREQRMAIEDAFVADMKQEGIDMGMSEQAAGRRATRLLLGPRDDSTVIGFKELLWDDRIPWDSTQIYKQQNTTYVQGPDGMPWATGFKRGGFASGIGFPKRPVMLGSSAIGVDSRLNTVDFSVGINTGLRGLVPLNESELIPTDLEQTEMIIDALKDLQDTAFTPYEPYPRSDGSGRWYRRGGGYGGYGGGGGGGGGFFSRMPTLPRGATIFGDPIRNIFWDNSLVRRTTIRRERYQSARGRLKQWQ